MAQEQVVVANEHQLFAPTRLRSQLLSLRYRAVRQGAITKQEADGQLTSMRGLQIRRLEDRVLQRVAWNIADKLGWPDTLDAEYVALTQLQADVLITRNEEFAAAVQGLVTVAPFAALRNAVSGLEAECYFNSSRMRAMFD
jgi:predicted nucleic acid-binding protein